jgi:hypothetical protein
MAATSIGFSQGSFEVERTPGVIGTGPNQLSFTTSLDGGPFTISSEIDRPISNFSIGDSDEPFIRLIGGGAGSDTVRDFNADLGDGDDKLVIGNKDNRDKSVTRRANVNLGEGNDTFINNAQFRNSSVEAGDGNDFVRISSNSKNVAVNSSFDMGDGDDRLVFGGSVKNVDIELGDGADKVKFRGDVTDVELDLGGDDDIDKVTIDGEIDGLTITGESDGDILMIGSSEYEFGGGSWINTEDPDDILNF